MTRYRVYITPQALREVKELPGHIRQRIREAIKALAEQPNPSPSKPLRFEEPDRQLFRLRLDNWRILYAITETEKIIDVIAVRKRPPYDYGDLAELLRELDQR